MAASCASERRAACSLQDLRSGTQHPRGDPRNDPATLAHVWEEEEEEEKGEEGEDERAARLAQAPVDCNTNTNRLGEAQISPEDFGDLADIYYSNKEYFRKLEELKTAHIETMAKLERMYQNKLRLKELRPLIIREDTYSASSGPLSENKYQPVSLVTALSEPDICQSPSLIMSSSEEELPNFETKYPQKKVTINSAKELINNMWRNFSVEDYIHCKGADFPAPEKTKKKPKAWVPKITIPQPFQMTIREQKLKEERLKSKSELEALHKMMQKKEDLECKKKFRANPVPSFVFFPPYRDLVKQNEERRRYMKEKNKEALLASQKPFNFVAREEQKRALQERLLRDLLKSKKKTNRFRAKPVPRSTYDLPANYLMKEEYERNLKLGNQDKLQYSTPVPSRLVLRSFALRKPKNTAKTEKLKKHKIKYHSADFEDFDLPEREQKYLEEHKYPKHLKDYQPDSYTTQLEISKRENKLEDAEADEQDLKEVCELYQFPRHRSPVRTANAKFELCNFKPPVPTVSSRGREEATRRSLENKKMLEEERNRILTKQKQRMKELQKLLINRAKAYDTHQSLAQMCKSRVKYLRKSEKERMREYQQELEEREERLKNRPLLFERVSQKNARMAAEKHYSNTLKALGISDEFVSKKGKSGKVFDYFNDQEMNNSIEDKESFNEERKIEERENGDTHSIIDTSSQDSGEEDEAHEEKEEEKLVEE